MPAGLSITSISPSRWSTRAWISSGVGWAVSMIHVIFACGTIFSESLSLAGRNG
jgi:hypothetical protein